MQEKNAKDYGIRPNIVGMLLCWSNELHKLSTLQRNLHASSAHVVGSGSNLVQGIEDFTIML
jgi:hypothetical protein